MDVKLKLEGEGECSATGGSAAIIAYCSIVKIGWVAGKMDARYRRSDQNRCSGLRMYDHTSQQYQQSRNARSLRLWYWKAVEGIINGLSGGNSGTIYDVSGSRTDGKAEKKTAATGRFMTQETLKHLTRPQQTVLDEMIAG